MSFLEVILIFICFCVISAVVELLKLVVQGKIVQQQQDKRIDALFVSFLRAFMRYKLEAVNLFKGENKNG